MAETPTLKTSLSLTSPTYRRSSVSSYPSIIATTTLTTPSPLTLDIRGEGTIGQTILSQDFHAGLFDFYDLTASTAVTQSPLSGTCDPGDELHRYDVVQLHASKPLVTRRVLEDVSPLSDPVRLLEVGHEYRLTLRPQKVWCFRGSVEELFGEREWLPTDKLQQGFLVTIASENELVLRVEA